MADEIMQNIEIDEGVNTAGVRNLIRLEGDQIIHRKTFDAEPLLKAAEHARQSTQGMNWGEGRIVGTIDPVSYGRISQIKDRAERDKAILDYFRERPQFVKFDGYYKTLFGVRKS